MANSEAFLTATGNLGRDPEQNFSQKGTSIVKTSMALNKYNPATKEADTIWLNLIGFGMTGDRMMEQGHKGDMVLVYGEFWPRAYISKDGKPGVAYEVVVSHFKVILAKEKPHGDADEDDLRDILGPVEEEGKPF